MMWFVTSVLQAANRKGRQRFMIVLQLYFSILVLKRKPFRTQVGNRNSHIWFTCIPGRLLSIIWLGDPCSPLLYFWCEQFFIQFFVLFGNLIDSFLMGYFSLEFINLFLIILLWILQRHDVLEIVINLPLFLQQGCIFFLENLYHVELEFIVFAFFLFETRSQIVHFMFYFSDPVLHLALPFVLNSSIPMETLLNFIQSLTVFVVNYREGRKRSTRNFTSLRWSALDGRWIQNKPWLLKILLRLWVWICVWI